MENGNEIHRNEQEFMSRKDQPEQPTTYLHERQAPSDTPQDAHRLDNIRHELNKERILERAEANLEMPVNTNIQESLEKTSQKPVSRWQQIKNDFKEMTAYKGDWMDKLFTPNIMPCSQAPDYFFMNECPHCNKRHRIGAFSEWYGEKIVKPLWKIEMGLLKMAFEDFKNIWKKTPSKVQKERTMAPPGRKERS